MRTPAPSDFQLDVEGVGHFVFGRRTLRDEARIAAEYSRLTEGVATPTEDLVLLASWMSTLAVLTSGAPEGWDVDGLDPLDPDTYTRLGKVYAALREKEGSFRRKPTPTSPAASA